MSNLERFFIIGAAFSITTVPALAVEYAMGRTLPGVWIQPQVGVVGPETAFSFTTMPLGYMGAIGGGRLVPSVARSLRTSTPTSAGTIWYLSTCTKLKRRR